MNAPSLSLVPVNGEPRIQDLQLGERLGFERPRKIRELIERNLENLKQISVCPTVGQTSGALGGRPTQAYYLDQRQSIFICMKADTANAFEVQLEIIDVFAAHLRGERPVPISPPAAGRMVPDGRYIELLEAENALLKQRRPMTTEPAAWPEVRAKRAPRPVTAEEEARVVALFNDGMSRHAIGRLLDRHARTIGRILDRATRESDPQIAPRLLDGGAS